MAKGDEIALFMIFLIFGVNIVAASGILGSDVVTTLYGDWAARIEGDMVGGTVAPQKGEEMSYPELAISSFGLLIRSLIFVILLLLYSTILLPVFLNQLAMPATITAAITVGTWISYLVTYNTYRARSNL